jgi:hypothetical protein
MTVKELKDKLNEFPDDMEITYEHYECGFDSYNGIKVVDYQIIEYDEKLGKKWIKKTIKVVKIA